MDVTAQHSGKKFSLETSSSVQTNPNNVSIFKVYWVEHFDKRTVCWLSEFLTCCRWFVLKTVNGKKLCSVYQEKWIYWAAKSQLHWNISWMHEWNLLWIHMNWMVLKLDLFFSVCFYCRRQAGEHCNVSQLVFPPHKRTDALISVWNHTLAWKTNRHTHTHTVHQ